MENYAGVTAIDSKRVVKQTYCVKLYLTDKRTETRPFVCPLCLSGASIL